MTINYEIAQIIQWASRRWERKSTIIVLILVMFFAGTMYYSGSDLANLTIWEMIVIVMSCIIVILLWKRSTSLPKAKRGRVGFAVAISCDTDELEKTIVSDLVGSLQNLINQDALVHKFEMVQIPNYHASKIHNAENAAQIRFAARCHFIVYGNARLRKLNGRDTHIINLKFQVAHRPVAKHLGMQLAKEMSELFPQNLHIDKDNDFLHFEVTSDWINCVSQYTIGIASSLSGDVHYAESLFMSLWNNQKLQNTNLIPLRKMRQRVPIRLGEIYAFWASNEYEKWRVSRDSERLNAMWEYLTKVRTFYPNNLASRHLAAIYYFIVKKDVDAAIRETMKSRTSHDGTWLLNYAFLLAYKGQLLKAKRIYQNASKQYYKRADVGNQCEEFMLWVLEREPKRIQLHFALGLLNWLIKGDYVLAKKHFEMFIEMNDSSSFNEPIRLANIYCNKLDHSIKSNQHSQNTLSPTRTRIDDGKPKMK